MPDSPLPPPVNVTRVLDRLKDEWSPQIVASINDYDIKIANVSGSFPEHRHDDTDEFFLVLDGHFELRLRDGTIRLDPGDTFTVPRGVDHAPSAQPGTRILIVEPRGTVNTGDPATGTTGNRVVELDRGSAKLP